MVNILDIYMKEGHALYTKIPKFDVGKIIHHAISEVASNS
jgi:hypothetical protein